MNCAIVAGTVVATIAATVACNDCTDLIGCSFVMSNVMNINVYCDCTQSRTKVWKRKY